MHNNRMQWSNLRYVKMRSITFNFLIVFSYLLVGQVSSGDIFTFNWLLAYVIFCAPFIFLLLSCALIPPGKEIIFSCFSWVMVLTGAVLILTNQGLYILPALGWFFLIASLFALVISAVVKIIMVACPGTRT